jgi:hypothetical protein
MVPARAFEEGRLFNGSRRRGVNIDPPVLRASLVKGEVAIAAMSPRALPRQNLFTPLQAQAGVILLAFRDEMRNQLSDILQPITPFAKVSSAESGHHKRQHPGR